ncbi:MAG TPA: lysoplasmalogenase [Candidatus Hydrogenedentes bacterium]|nr:lysoplasmalogenase [Candidatus Hydrogenedentota bacterium]
MNQDETFPKTGFRYTGRQELWRSIVPWMFLVISAFCAMGVTLAVSSGWGALHLPCVLGASTGFVLVAIAAGGLYSVYGRFIIAGLIACWCGDVLGAQYFLTGLFAFCLAHVAFICAFITKGIVWKRVGVAAGPMAIVLVIILRWLLPQVQNPAEVIAVCIYATAISTMVITAFGASEGPVGRLILSGALIIYVSDIFVSGWKYAGFSSDIGRFCYPLYYSACLIFAMSVLARKRALANSAGFSGA